MNELNENPQQKPEEKERKRRPIIYWIIILILIFLCLSLFIRQNQIADTYKATQAQLDSVKTDRTALQNDFDAASAKIDQLVTDNAKLDSTLETDRNEIIDLQKKIRSLLSNKKASGADLVKAREMINSLNTKTSQYEARIAELEKENTILTNKNAVLIQERDSTVTQNIALKKIASVLHASNMRLEAINKTRKGREKETSRARKADLIRIVFDIDENRVVENGNKQVYIRMVGPDGEVLSSPLNGSGLMVTAKGDQVKYSIMKEVALQKAQTVKDIIVVWQLVGVYGRGNYLFEIYSEGYKIGSGDVRLR
jgi:peptidoglycan hydrolase CwlO-like protein